MNHGRFDPSGALYLSCGTSVTRSPINGPILRLDLSLIYMSCNCSRPDAQDRLCPSFAANTTGSEIFSGIEEDTCHGQP